MACHSMEGMGMCGSVVVGVLGTWLLTSHLGITGSLEEEVRKSYAGLRTALHTPTHTTQCLTYSITSPK